MPNAGPRAVKVIRREAAELSEHTIASIIEDALQEQRLLDALADAVRAGDEQEIVRAARAVCHMEDALPPAA